MKYNPKVLSQEQSLSSSTELTLKDKLYDNFAHPSNTYVASKEVVTRGMTWMAATKIGASRALLAPD